MRRKELCQTIINYIRDNELEAGHRLPPERLLARECGVQRLTIRRALKHLCAEGLLITRPQSGTYLKQSLEDYFLETLPRPTAISTSRDRRELVFTNDDRTLPHIISWKKLFRKFEKRHRGVKVIYDPEPNENAGNFNLGVKILHWNHAGYNRDNSLTVPGTWLDAKTPDSCLPTATLDKINSLGKDGNEFFAVPLCMTCPLQIINLRLMNSKKLPVMPSHGDWHALENWLDVCAGRAPGFLNSPFIHTILHHLVRIDRSILERDKCDLNTPELREFIYFIKSTVEAAGTAGMGLNMMRFFLNEFISGRKFLSGETYIHFLPLFMAAYKREHLATAFNCVSPNGEIQIIPRCLVFGRDAAKHPDAVDLARFLCSREAQLELAAEGLGIPYFNCREGIEVISEKMPVKRDELEYELSNAYGCFDHLFFSLDIREKLIDFLMMEFFSGRISFEKTIDKIINTVARIKSSCKK